MEVSPGAVCVIGSNTVTTCCSTREEPAAGWRGRGTKVQ